MKRTLYIYLLSIFMLANGALFTWLFLGTPLSFWRQLIWGFGLYVVIKNYHKFKDPKLNRFLRLHSYFCCYVIAMSAITILIYNFNLMRIIYAFWMYFSGLPFILLPYIYKQQGLKPENLFKTFAYLGLFLTLGLIIDYTTGGFFTKSFLLATASDLGGLLEADRYCFLSEAPTTFAVYYSFCMVSTLYLMYSTNEYKKKFIYFCITLSFFLGAFFTGSRQIVAALGIVFSISLIYYILFVKDKKTFIAASLIIATISLPYINRFINSGDSYYKERYNTESIKEDSRYAAWEDGLNETILSGDIKTTLVGKAVALSQGQKAAKGEILGRHYENTFYSRWSELGIYGTLFIFIPICFVIKRMKKLDFLNVLITSLFISYLFISYISPNGIHQTTQMVIYISIGIFLCKDYFAIRK